MTRSRKRNFVLDRNLLLAFVLSFLVLYTFSAMEQSRNPVPSDEMTVEEGEPRDPLAAAREQPASERYADLPGDAPAPPRLDRAPVESDEVRAAGVIEIERPLYRAQFSTLGAGISGWELLSYRDRAGHPVAIIDPDQPVGLAAVTPMTSLGLGDLSRENWRVENEGPDELVFALEKAGVRIRKTFVFDEGYGIRIQLGVENGSQNTLSPRFLMTWPAGVREENDFREQYLSALKDGELESELVAGFGAPGWFGGSEPTIDHVGEIDWTGVQATYFVSALLPDRPTESGTRFASVVEGTKSEVQLFFTPVEVPPGQEFTREIRAYIGPKESARLVAFGSGLEESIDLGWSWVAPLTRFFNGLLEAMYSIIPNYGIAIILITILVRVVTIPLTTKQMKSMERMRRIQPQMKALQEKYADDRQKQSEEVMALYKREGVNPLGGCFPMLLQLPVFIGLFYALRSSIHLRQAPFVGWIDDLSAPDQLFSLPGLELPVRVLPLIMGGTMFLQQKITPMQTADPAQARMMMTVMPVMMTVLFYQFASGLVLYWMMSNILAIAHQLWTGRNMDPPANAAVETKPA